MMIDGSRRLWCTLLVTACLVPPVVAQEAAEDNDPVGVMISADVLIGETVENDLSGKSATLQTLMIDPEKGCIEMVVLALEDEDGSTVAVPWDRLVMDADGTLHLSVTDEELASAPRMRRAAPSAEASEAPQAPETEEAEAPESAAAASGQGESRLQITRAPPQANQAPAATRARASAAGQEPPNPQGSYVPNDVFSARYDPGTVQRFEGVVVGAIVAPVSGDSDDMVLLVDVGRPDDVRVHLGPEWFLDRLNVAPQPDDAISFVGSEITVDDETIVLVSELTTGEGTVALRERDGTPRW